jgi:hypothetical protein
MFQESTEESVHGDVSLDHVLNVRSGQLSSSSSMPSAHHRQLPDHPSHRRHHLVVVVPQLQGQGHRKRLGGQKKMKYV